VLPNNRTELIEAVKGIEVFTTIERLYMSLGYGTPLRCINKKRPKTLTYPARKSCSELLGQDLFRLYQLTKNLELSP